MARADPVVSILLPVRDESAHLDEAMTSLASQTFGDFEVIGVDDGSTDGTTDLLDEWTRRDSRVRVVRQAPAGIVAALERARTVALGRYVARMDADDVAAPERLERQLELMDRETDLAGCGCGVRYFPRSVLRDGARRYERWINSLVEPDDIAASVFVECPLAHPTFFLRAGVLESVGGYRECGWPEDYDLVLRLWAGGERLGKVQDVLHHWRERPERLSRTDPRYAAAAFLDCKVHHLRATLLRAGRGVVVWGAGPLGKRLARALLAAGTPVVAFVELDPRKIGQEIHGAPVLDAGAGVEVRGPLHLAAVGQAGARSRITSLLTAHGHRPTIDFTAVA